MTRIAEGGTRRGAAPVADVTLRVARFLSSPLIGPPALVECAGLALASGGALRATSPAERLRPGLGSGLTDGVDFSVGDELESAEGDFAKDSEPRVLSLDFSSEGVA